MPMTKVANLVLALPFGTQGLKKYVTVGALLRASDNDESKGPGFVITLDTHFNPAGAPCRDGSVFLSTYFADRDRTPREQPKDTHRAPPPKNLVNSSDFEDMQNDIPF